MKQDQDSIKNLHQRRLVAFIGPHRDLIKMTAAKIYTSNKYGDHWLDSGIEGYLCFITDKEYKTRFLVMYSFISYTKEFELEIYNNFKSYYQVLEDTFHCFEFGEGFIGFQYLTSEDANMFKLVIDKFDDKLFSMVINGAVTSKGNKEVINRNIKLIKEKFSSKTVYDENYVESELFINKPRYFEVLANIRFDRENNQFIAEGEETIELLKACKMKKSEMKNIKLALDMFKKLILILENVDQYKKKNNKRPLHSFELKYLQHAIQEKVISEKEEHLYFVNDIETITSVKETENENDLNNTQSNSITSLSTNNTTNIPNIPKVPNIPNVPKIPNNIPNVPKIPNIPNNIPNVPKIPIINNSILQKIEESKLASDKLNEQEPTPEVSVQQLKEEELKKVILKKAEPKSEEPVDLHTQMKRAIEKGVQLSKAVVQENKKITLNDKTILSQTLSMALQQRRKDMGNDQKNDSDSDWDS